MVSDNGETDKKPTLNSTTEVEGLDNGGFDSSEATKKDNKPNEVELVHLDRKNGDTFTHYYLPVNTHKKLLRGEKLYVTRDRRSQSFTWRKILICAVIWVLVAVVCILSALAATGMIMSQSSGTSGGEVELFLKSNDSTEYIELGTDIPTAVVEPWTGNPIPMRVLQGSFPIVNLKYDDSLLQDEDSLYYRSLKRRLENDLYQVYSSWNVWQVSVTNFSQGSVIVYVTLAWKQNEPKSLNANEARQKLVTYLNLTHGFLSQFAILTSAIHFEEEMSNDVTAEVRSPDYARIAGSGWTTEAKSSPESTTDLWSILFQLTTTRTTAQETIHDLHETSSQSSFTLDLSTLRLHFFNVSHTTKQSIFFNPSSEQSTSKPSTLQLHHFENDSDITTSIEDESFTTQAILRESNATADWRFFYDPNRNITHTQTSTESSIDHSELQNNDSESNDTHFPDIVVTEESTTSNDEMMTAVTDKINYLNITGLSPAVNAMDSVTDNSINNSTESATDNSIGNSTDSTTDNSIDNLTDSATDNPIDNLTVSATDNSADNLTDSTTDNSTDNSINNLTDSATDNSIDSLTDSATDNSIDNLTVSATDNSADNSTDNSTDNATKNTTGNVTENTTDNATENTTGNATENTTDYNDHVHITEVTSPQDMSIATVNLFRTAETENTTMMTDAENTAMRSDAENTTTMTYSENKSATDLPFTDIMYAENNVTTVTIDDENMEMNSTNESDVAVTKINETEITNNETVIETLNVTSRSENTTEINAATDDDNSSFKINATELTDIVRTIISQFNDAEVEKNITENNPEETTHSEVTSSTEINPTTDLHDDTTLNETTDDKISSNTTNNKVTSNTIEDKISSNTIDDKIPGNTTDDKISSNTTDTVYNEMAKNFSTETLKEYTSTVETASKSAALESATFLPTEFTTANLSEIDSPLTPILRNIQLTSVQTSMEDTATNSTMLSTLDHEITTEENTTQQLLNTIIQGVILRDGPPTGIKKAKSVHIDDGLLQKPTKINEFNSHSTESPDIIQMTNTAKENAKETEALLQHTTQPKEQTTLSSESPDGNNLSTKEERPEEREVDYTASHHDEHLQTEWKQDENTTLSLVEHTHQSYIDTEVTESTVSNLVTSKAKDLVKTSTTESLADQSTQLPTKESSGNFVSKTTENIVSTSTDDTVSTVSENIVRLSTEDTVSTVNENIVSISTEDTVSTVTENIVSTSSATSKLPLADTTQAEVSGEVGYSDAQESSAIVDRRRRRR